MYVVLLKVKGKVLNVVDKVFGWDAKRKESIWDTNIFFLPPDGLAAAILWDFYKECHMYIGGMLLCGNDDMGIQASYVDTVTNKHYWRDILRDVGALVPKKRAEWDGYSITWSEGMSPSCVEGQDLVLKLHNSYLGIGDRFLEHGVDFHTAEDLEMLIRDKYPASSLTGEPLTEEEALAAEKVAEEKGSGTRDRAPSVDAPPVAGALIIMDWVRPLKGIEPAPSNDVHQLDILTLRVPGKGVQLASCMYWGDCTNATTHTARSGFVCDVESETILEKASWYGPYFSKFVPKEDTVGRRLPGMKEAIAMSIKAHEKADLPFLATVGWDAMITPNGPVFFEGNFGISRMPRRIFLNWSNFFFLLFHQRFLFGPPAVEKPKSQ